MSSISSIHGAMDGKFLKTLTVGKPNFATGKIRIDGTTSGRVTITTAAAAGTWTLTLPSTGGTADYVLSTDGAGIASWISGQSIAGLKTTSTPQFLRLGLNQAADTVASLAATQTAIGATSTDGYVLQNTTAAAAGAQQYSPRIRLTGQGWKTNVTAASQTVDWIVENQPVQGAANPTTNLVFSSQVNAAGYVTQLTLQSGVNALFAGTGQMTRLGLGTAADAAILATISRAAGGEDLQFIGSTTNNHFLSFVNTGTRSLFGIESSAGGTIFVGTSAYAMALGTTDTNPLQFATNNNVRMTIASGGNVGIGTTNPSLGQLQVVKVGTTGRTIYITGIAGQDSPIFQIDAASGGAGLLIVQQDGKVSIGSTTATSMFNVGTSAQFQVSSTGAVLFGAATLEANYYLEGPNDVAKKAKANAWDVYSDSRFKLHQMALDPEQSLRTLLRLIPKSYEQMDGGMGSDGKPQFLFVKGTPTVGFVAQDVVSVWPTAVSVPQDESKELWGLNYDKFIPLTVSAIKALAAENAGLRARVEVLERKVN